MMRGQKALRYVLLAALASLAAGGCDDGSDVPEAIVCARVDDVWDAHVDVNGWDASQRWTISQGGCIITITPDLAHCFGVFICENATGYVVESSVSASWIYYSGPCRYTSVLEATVSGSTMAGTLYWWRSPYGNGYCSSAYGVGPMSGTRL